MLYVIRSCLYVYGQPERRRNKKLFRPALLQYQTEFQATTGIAACKGRQNNSPEVILLEAGVLWPVAVASERDLGLRRHDKLGVFNRRMDNRKKTIGLCPLGEMTATVARGVLSKVQRGATKAHGLA